MLMLMLSQPQQDGFTNQRVVKLEFELELI